MLCSRVAQRLTVAEVRFACSLGAAALDGLFEHAAGCSGAITMREITAAYSCKNRVFRSLLAKNYRIGAAVATDDGAFKVGGPACIGPTTSQQQVRNRTALDGSM